MSDTLKQRIVEDMKAAMRARDKERLAAVRLITAALKQVEVDERLASIDDVRTLAVLQKMLKQRRDSIAQYTKANRQDLADREAYEVAIIESYMPEPLGDAELEQLIEAALGDTGAESMRDMGKVMAKLKDRVQGRADMGAVSAKVKNRLASSG
ncbi:MAG: GatB/YqeY domain-containing protein [Gammaproteobacteria bacterium]|nr:GatB/YqeY domain-containing protein [Gammaproteobacteria bacterium]